MKVALILNGKTPQSTQYKPLPVSVPDLLARYPKMGKILKNTAPEHRGVPVDTEINHSLLGAFYQAYSNHHNLVLRPDDIWLAIMIAFAGYISDREQEFRKFFYRT